MSPTVSSICIRGLAINKYAIQDINHRFTNKEITMAPGPLENDTRNGNATPRKELKAIVNELRELQAHVQRIQSAIETPEVQSWLNEQLHHPDQLPDKELEQRALDLVDSMDKLQLQLVPSVSLLTDGFFGKRRVL